MQLEFRLSLDIVPRYCKFALGLLVRGIAAVIPLVFGLGGLEVVTGQLQK